MEFERAIRGRISKAKTEWAKKEYTQWNPVYERWDLVQPAYQLHWKLAAAFTGLVFMVRGNHNSHCEHLSFLFPHYPLTSSRPFHTLTLTIPLTPSPSPFFPSEWTS